MKIAYRIYPVPNGTVYTEADIQSIDDVVMLFDYCQILEANISKEGWRYLVDEFGVDRLYEADKKSGWFDCGSIDEFSEAINF
jgi:hypothetical protein